MNNKNSKPLTLSRMDSKTFYLLAKQSFSWKVFVSLISIFLVSCSTSSVYYGKQDRNWNESAPVAENELVYSLYLIGDVGADTSKSGLVLNRVSAHLKNEATDKSGIVFLGDNIYPWGLHKKNSEYRAQDELRLNAQLDIVTDYNGKVVFIPGNHDWNHGRSDGLKYVKRQEKYVSKYLKKDDVFLPANGCPGPTEVELAPGLLLIVLDTQWWLHQFEKSSGEKDECDVRTTQELKKAFNDMLKKYRNQNIIVVGHHPLYSNGNHGGHFKLKDHLFPITASKYKKAYIPFPVIGSIYPLYRKFIGLNQDIPHPIYRKMKKDMEDVMNGFDNVVYVSGHEHNLQYTHNKSIHHIISGSGSKANSMNFNRDLSFGAIEKGYSKICYYENGETWLEAIIVDQETKEEKIAFRKLLYTKKGVAQTQNNVDTKVSYAGMFKKVSPDSTKIAKGLSKVLYGDLNRATWTAEISVPYLDIHKEKGGLTPIKKGGGMQTISLRMLGGDGKQYTLRGIKKSPEFIIDKKLRGTVAQDLIYDGFAGSHPYASAVVPYISKEAGVYYSDSKLVYVPKDPILGEYLEEFGGLFCILEQRPDNDVSDQANFGNSEKVMSFIQMNEKIHSKQTHKIDPAFGARTRLFDMLIGDFDRHDDQWRWAQIDTDSFTLYRPIPRDRDQAFFRGDGLGFYMTKWKWLLWYTQDFYGSAKDVIGLNQKGRHFDRSFLMEADRDVWIAQAEYIKANLSDQDIEDAVRKFPPEAFEIKGQDIIESLKIRRDELPSYAATYYKVLAKTVDVVATYEDDFFLINRKENGDVEVSVYARKKGKREKDKMFYHRVFKHSETKEIRLYGLDGKDEYQIKGESNKSILVRIIAGDSKDKITDESKVSGLRKMTLVYDEEGKSDVEKSPETKVTEMPARKMYDYDRLAFKYNRWKPVFSLGYNINDGFYIGPGFSQTFHGFKKNPYKFHHKFMANYTARPNGFNLFYDFHLVDAIGKGDLKGALTVNSPLAFQYFGATKGEVDEDSREYDVLMENYKFEPSLTFSSKSLANNLVFSANYNYVDFETETVPNVDAWELKAQQFIGGKVEYQFLNKDNELNPNNGMEFKLGGEYTRGITNTKVDFFRLNSSLSLFLPVKFIRNQTTLALRSGIATNIGDYAFFQSNFLSGFENFRGVRRNRYSGQSSNFNNAEIRMNLFKIRNYIVPLDIGAMAHFDVAKIWGGVNEDWQTSYGGGVFVSAIDAFMLFGTYSISNQDGLLVIGSKFLF
jgi:hypothetical protein